ncbi:uncharacterized protein BDV14DRAFT_171093 [Aspergillus stella-maris]|uniref:uncharacterized protein n=1 Tax=Aspergillus stella-maris TaxID=1810926 RepID=UPI003CCDF5FE
MSTTKTPITELALPIFKDDAETLSTIQSEGNAIFGHLAGVPGVQFIAYGFVLYDEGKKVESSNRGVLLLEWDDPSSFAEIYPNSPKFVEFIESVKPFLAGPPAPKLHVNVTSPVGAGSAGVTQIVKVKEGLDTEEIWARLGEYLRGKEETLPLASSKGTEGEEGLFLGLIGWASVERYEESKNDETIVRILEQLVTNGKEVDVVAQLQTIPV